MSHRLHSAAIHLAIVAMLLRALLPAGWMPNPGGGAPFTICTVDGTGHHTDGNPSGKPGPQGDRHAHDECPFAAAPHIAAPVPLALLSTPQLTSQAVVSFGLAGIFGLSPSYQPHPPRAPPPFA